MEYGATIWNPYLKGDIDKLERIQNKAVRFIKRNYRDQEVGSVTRMRQELELETLEDRRISLWLILMYKVVEGLVPALPASRFTKPARPKRRITPKCFQDFNTTNLVNKHVCNNSRGLTIPDSRTPQYENSFFVHTTVHWNQLPDSVVHASSVEAFKSALQRQR